MDGNWEIELWDEETATGDGGHITLTRITHMATGLTVAAKVCEYEDDPRLVDVIVRDDFSLATSVTRRLIAKIYDNYAHLYHHHRDMGSINIITYVVLVNLLGDLYLPCECERVSAMMHNAYNAILAEAALT